MICTPNDALLSEIFLYLVRAAWELRSTRYGPKHALWWLSYMPFCAYMYMYSQVQLENYRLLRTFYLSNDCSSIEDIYSLG